MKARTLLIIVLILLVAGFCALNLEEILRPTTLNLGVTELQAPLGLVLLGMIAVMVVLFLALQLYQQATHMLEIKRLTKEANEQRLLADKAEASRFTDLRQYLATEMQTIAGRERDIADRLHDRLNSLQLQVERVVEQSGNGLSAAIGELEDRLERRLPPSETDAL